MKKLGIVLVALVVLSLMAAPFVQAADDEGRGGQGERQGMFGRGFDGERPRGPRPDGDEDPARRHSPPR